MRVSLLVAIVALAGSTQSVAQRTTDSTLAQVRVDADSTVATLKADSAAGRRAKRISQLATGLPILLSLGSGASEQESPLGLLTGLAMYFGPAAGYWAAGMTSQGWKGVGIRFGVVTLGAVAAIAVMPKERTHTKQEYDDQMNSTSMRVATGLLLGGVAGFVVSSVKDIRGVEHAVIEHRAKERASLASAGRPGSEFAVAPSLSLVHKTAGLSAKWTF